MDCARLIGQEQSRGFIFRTLAGTGMTLSAQRKSERFGQITGCKKRHTSFIKHLDKLVCNKLSASDFKQTFALQHVCQPVSPL